MTMFLLSIVLLFPNYGKLITLDLIAILLRLFQTIGEFNKHLSMGFSTFVHLEKFDAIESNKREVFSSNFTNSDKMSTSNLIEVKNIDFKYLNDWIHPKSTVFSNLNLFIRF